MNVFTTDAFLETAGELFFPRRSRQVEICRLEGRRIPLLVLDGREVVGRMPFYDFPQPLNDSKGPVDREIGWLPRTVVRTTRIEDRTPETQEQQPSPYIDWKKHPSWAAFEAEWKPKSLHSDSPRMRRRLEKELGPLRFSFDDTRPEAFDACVAWKSAQYRATGLTDMFADRRHVELFRRLRAHGVVVVNSLSAGETLVATHFASSHDRRLGWWIPAYDVRWSKFSPGRLMLEELLKASFARGDVEFDFLIGDEAYKFQYATHNRVIGPVGTPPLRLLLMNKARKQAKALLERNPRALELARNLQKRIRDWKNNGPSRA